MTDLRILHPNIEWEGRQTCAMNSEELLAIRKLIREKRDYRRSRSDSLHRCTVDIRRILAIGQEIHNTVPAIEDVRSIRKTLKSTFFIQF